MCAAGRGQAASSCQCSMAELVSTCCRSRCLLQSCWLVQWRPGLANPRSPAAPQPLWADRLVLGLWLRRRDAALLPEASGKGWERRQSSAADRTGEHGPGFSNIYGRLVFGTSWRTCQVAKPSPWLMNAEGNLLVLLVPSVMRGFKSEPTHAVSTASSAILYQTS